MTQGNQPGATPPGVSRAPGARLAKILTSGAWKRVVSNSANGEPAPAAYTIDSAKRLVAVKFRKQLTAREIVAYATALRRDRAFDANFAEIVDLCEVEEIELDAKEALHLADKIDPFSLASKRAFVAQSSTQINSVRLHALLRSHDKNIRIFGSIEEARRWIEMGV